MTKLEIEKHAKEVEKWLIAQVKDLRLDHHQNNTMLTIKLGKDLKLGNNHVIRVWRDFVPGSTHGVACIAYYDGTYNETVPASYDQIQYTDIGFKIHLLRDWGTIKPQIVEGIERINADVQAAEDEDERRTKEHNDLEDALCDLVTDFKL